jgi:hypothetical protein
MTAAGHDATLTRVELGGRAVSSTDASGHVV